MLINKKGSPEKEELVKGKVRKILPQCAFLELEKYKGKKAVLHVSEISDEWTEAIKDELEKGEELICKVIDVNEEMELSLRKVKDDERLEKKREANLEKRAERILKAAAERGNISKKEVKKIEKNIYDESGSLYGYLELGKEKGFDVFEEVGASEELIKHLEKVFKKRKDKVKIKKRIRAVSFEMDGVEKMKDLLTGFENLKVNYLGAPKYLLEYESLNYKKGEKELDEIIKKMKEKGEGKGVKIQRLESKK